MHGEQFIRAGKRITKRQLGGKQLRGVRFILHLFAEPWSLTRARDLRKVLHACAVPYYFEANLRIPREK